MKFTKNIDILNQSRKVSTRSGIYFLISASLAALAALAACGGGGGGGVVEAPESAVVQTVSAAQVLEGAAGTTSQLEFLVTLDKPAVKGVDVSFSSGSTAKAGVDSKEFAKGGSSCVAGIDFVSATNGKVSIAKGASTAKLTIAVCGDNIFAPNKTLKITWSAAGSTGGSAIGTILNDDAGGLNGTGATTVMGGAKAFGRDTNVLTNDPADGALGFSFEKQLSAAAWNCTYDKVSGLTWQRVPGVTRDFASLGSYAAGINAASACGYSDWRVPTANELLTLMDSSRTAAYGAVNADREGVLEAAMNGQYWTSESLPAVGAVDAWLVDVANGGAVSYAAKTSSLGVRLVRGSANSTACNNNDARFVDLTDGTVTDAKTGLMWKQCQEGLSGTACTSGTPLVITGVNTITDRLAAVNSTPASIGLGYSDWRIPTKNELASLANRSCTGNLAIVSSVFPANDSVSYVSSTFDANNTTQFWYVDFFQGTVATAGVSAKRLRLVRSGQ